MKTVSIGYHREDGDFAVLATLNNLDGSTTAREFRAIVRNLRDALRQATGHAIVILERQDTPDYVCLNEPDTGPRTQEEARQWLISNDPEGADLWRSLPDSHNFLAAYRANIREHGPP